MSKTKQEEQIIMSKITWKQIATISDIQYMLRKWEFSDEIINKIEAILNDNALEFNPWLNEEVE